MKKLLCSRRGSWNQTSVARFGPAAGLTLVLAFFSAPAFAQTLRPWVPPDADSLVRWSAEAKSRFRTNVGDSVGGANLMAYELVGMMGRRLVRSIGRENVKQAYAVEPVLDSLGLDTEVSIDPALPYFVLLTVRNPHRLTAAAVGYLYWYKGNDLRMQGIVLHGGIEPQMSVWWTGIEQAPYTWAIVDRDRGPEPHAYVSVLQLTRAGLNWRLSQFGATALDLGRATQVSFADINGDLKPELVTWIPAPHDSVFETCSDCPKIYSEALFVERSDGFWLHDSRVLPTPYSTFVLFIRQLLDNNRAAASRLLKDPAMLQSALQAGWGTRHANGTWRVENVEPGTAWPQWLQLRFRGPTGDRRYLMRFELKAGRWVIRDWSARDANRAGTPSGR